MSPINFNRKVEALATLRLQVNDGVIEVYSAGINLRVSFALRNLIDDTNRGDCSVVSLVGERESDVLGHDLQER